MKISIITVTLNNASVIKKCLDSLKSQKYNNIEHIIVDGGSTDKTLSILKSRNKQLSVVLSEPDKGIYDAMNKGIKLATGEIIGFLNSDDFYSSNEVLLKVANTFKKEPQLDSCYADLIYTDRVDTSKKIRYVKSSEYKQGLFSKGWCPGHTTFFARSSVYKRYGDFDTSYSLASDFDLMMRFLEIHKIKSRYVPEIWVKMRLGGATNKNLKNIYLQNKEIFSSFQKNNVKVNIIFFFVHKIISRLKQFF
ncbi:glycosyltransferase [Candidatus Pelagibacter sp.]|nr:glycosyltransferase [Candidatus Pelagibacter sp.]